jgi:hypothetical protein
VPGIVCKHLCGPTNCSLKKRSFHRIPAFMVFLSKCAQTPVSLASVYTHNFEWFTLPVVLSFSVFCRSSLCKVAKRLSLHVSDRFRLEVPSHDRLPVFGSLRSTLSKSVSERGDDWLNGPLTDIIVCIIHLALAVDPPLKWPERVQSRFALTCSIACQINVLDRNLLNVFSEIVGLFLPISIGLNAFPPVFPFPGNKINQRE